MTAKFNCEECGACCEAACCPRFNKETRHCTCYDTRPDICNVETMYQQRKDSLTISKEEYFQLNKEICKLLREYVRKQSDLRERQD